MDDTMHVVHPRAAGLDIHKMAITATVRLAQPGGTGGERHPGVLGPAVGTCGHDRLAVGDGG